MRIEGTFAFVDMAGFTALTEAQGDEDAADLATMFADITRAALGPGDRLVKTIGDAVLVTSKDPAPALVSAELTVRCSNRNRSCCRRSWAFRWRPC